MRISSRIEEMVRAVGRGESAADIGTDHAYVPLILYRDGISPEVIMSDISEGSLAKARASFHDAGIDVPDSWFRTADGLDGIRAGEVDDVIIGGLGGLTMIGILSKDIAKTKSFRRLILQPRNNSGSLRYFLFVNGFDIVAEKLCEEGKFVCEVITAVPTCVTRREPPYDESDIRWKYPESFRDCDRDLLKKRLAWKIGSIEEQIENLGRSSGDMSERRERLASERDYLRSLLEDR
jgi:tRNA (adenine22-N1)-methyltransferase